MEAPSTEIKTDDVKEELKDLQRDPRSESADNPDFGEFGERQLDPLEQEYPLDLREALENTPCSVTSSNDTIADPNEPPLPMHPHVLVTEGETSFLREEDLVTDISEHPAAIDESNHCPGLANPATLPLYYISCVMAPIAFFAGLAAGIGGPLFTELLKSRVCTTEYQNNYICGNLSDPVYQHEEAHVDSITAYYSFSTNLIANLPCAFFAIFTGSWSDHFGRKLPMVLPQVGMTASAGLLILFTYISTHPAFLLFVPVLYAVFGGWIISSAAIYSYIGDNSTPKTLAIDLTIFDGVYLVAANIGNLIGGVLFGLYGFTYSIILYGGLLLLTLLYTLLIIRDRKLRRGDDARRGCSALFTTRSIKENKEMLMKQRSGQTRFHIILMLACVTVSSTCNTGSGLINQLFFESSPLNWDLELYMIFSGVAGIATSLIMMASTPILKNLLGFEDTLVGIVGITSTVFSYIAFSACKQMWLAVVAVTVGALSGLQYPAARALLSNWVDVDERGKMMSVIAALQALVPIFGSFLFTSSFAASVSWWPGFSYAMASLVMLAVLVGYCYVDLKRRGVEYTEPVASGYARI